MEYCERITPRKYLFNHPALKIHKKNEKIIYFADFNNRKWVENQSNQIDPDDYDKKTINELAERAMSDKNEFALLSIVMYRVHGIKHRIAETIKQCNSQFIDEDDLFQEYITILWECILRYDPSKKTYFDNYFIFMFHCAFLQIKKNSFFRVTGSLSSEDSRNNYYVSSADETYVIGETKRNNIDEKIMEEHINELIENVLNDDEKIFIREKFFSNSGKKITYKDISKKTGINERRLKYLKKTSFIKLKKADPYLKDFFYDRRELSEQIHYKNIEPA